MLVICSIIRRTGLDQIQKPNGFSLLSIKLLISANLNLVRESTYFLADHRNLPFFAHHAGRAVWMPVTLLSRTTLLYVQVNRPRRQVIPIECSLPCIGQQLISAALRFFSKPTVDLQATSDQSYRVRTRSEPCRRFDLA